MTGYENDRSVNQQIIHLRPNLNDYDNTYLNSHTYARVTEINDQPK